MKHPHLHIAPNIAYSYLKYIQTLVSKKKPIILWRSLLTVLLICLCFDNAQAKTPLHIGFLEYAVSDISIEDTKVAINLYLQKVLKDTRFEPQTVFFQNIEDLKNALHNQTIEMASISSVDFLLLSPDSLLVASTIRVSYDNNIFNAYTLLVHKDRNWSSLAELQNTHLRFPHKETISEIWLDVLLAENNLPQMPQFFSKITQDERASQSVLAVFFNQADACIITTRSFQIISELNPQISQAVISLAVSPEYLPSILCFHTKLSLSDREVLEQAALSLANNTEGKQVLKLFKSKEVIKVKPIYFETISHLLIQHEKYYGTRN